MHLPDEYSCYDFENFLSGLYDGFAGYEQCFSYNGTDATVTCHVGGGGMSSGAKIGIVAGGLILGMMIVVIIVWLMLKSKVQNEAETDIYEAEGTIEPSSSTRGILNERTNGPQIV